MSCLVSDCLYKAVASLWVDFYHSTLTSKAFIEKEKSEMHMSCIQRDLTLCMSRLHAKESDLETKIVGALEDAKSRKLAGDVAGAKRRLVDKRRMEVSCLP